MRRDVTLTMVRALRDEEDQILAQHGRRAEQIISSMRLLIQALRVITVPALIALGFIPTHTLDLKRMVGLGAYTAWCIAAFAWVRRRSTASVLGDRVLPHVFNLIDFGFILFMGL